MHDLVRFLFNTAISAVIGSVTTALILLGQGDSFTAPFAVCSALPPDDYTLSLITFILFAVFVPFTTSLGCDAIIQVRYRASGWTWGVLGKGLKAGAIGVLWALFFFVVVGSLGAAVSMILHQRIIFHAFFTSGILAALILTPVGTVVIWLLREHVLHRYTPNDVYELRVGGLTRMFLPTSIQAVAFGILASYLLVGIGTDSVLASAYSYRYQILFAMVFGIGALTAIEYTYNRDTFLNLVLFAGAPVRNFVPVWAGFLFTWLIGFVIGMELFQHVIMPQLFQISNP